MGKPRYLLKRWCYPAAPCGRSGRAGFTLTEVVVAMAVVTITIMAIYGAFSFTRRATVLAEERLASLHIARQAMETLRCHPYDDSILQECNRKRPLPGFPSNRGHFTIVEDKANLVKTIDVVVEWRSPWGKEQSLTLTTMMSWNLRQ